MEEFAKDSCKIYYRGSIGVSKWYQYCNNSSGMSYCIYKLLFN